MNVLMQERCDEDMDKRLELYKTKVAGEEAACQCAQEDPADVRQRWAIRGSAATHISPPGLRKGVPSLFQNLRQLYSDPDKVRRSARRIDHCCLIRRRSLSKSCSVSSRIWRKTGTRAEVLTVRRVNRTRNATRVCFEARAIWRRRRLCSGLYYFLAQHYDRLANPHKAHLYIDRAIQHTPTLIELLMTKSQDLQGISMRIENASFSNSSATRCLMYSRRAENQSGSQNTVPTHKT